MNGGKKAKKIDAEPTLDWLRMAKKARLAKNDELITTLEMLSESNRFSQITLFKTHLNGPNSSGPTGSSAISNAQDDGMNARIPDIGGSVHHEGVVLEIESTISEFRIPDIGGSVHHEGEGTWRGRKRYMQLDFGSSGLGFTVSSQFPEIPDAVPWSGKLVFKQEEILPQHGDITILIAVIQSLTGARDHIVRFNCQRFAGLVWDSYIHSTRVPPVSPSELMFQRLHEHQED
jgi:hypothetical protein